MRRRPKSIGKTAKSQGRKAQTKRRRDAPSRKRPRRSDAAPEGKLANYIREREEAQARQGATAEILKVISRSTFDLQMVLDTLTKRAVQLCAADGGVISMQDGDVYRVRAVYGFSSDGKRYLLEHPLLPRNRSGVTGRVALSGKAVHIPDVLADPEYAAMGYQRALRQRTNLGVPLLRDGTAIGVFSLTRTKVDPFTDKQIELVTTFADQAVIAIENTRLVNELRDSERQLRKARDEAVKQQTAASEMMRIVSNSPIQSVLNAVAENAARLCDSNNAEIYRLENNCLRLVASYGEIPVHVQARAGFPADRHRVIGRAICDRQSVHVHDLATEECEYPSGSNDAKLQGHRTTLATPLMREQSPIGVILFRRWEVRPFSDSQIALLETFADQAAMAIESVRLFQAEKERTLSLAQRENELRLLLETIPTLVCRAGPDGDIEYVNKRVLEYFGVPGGEILGWGWMDKVHPDDIAFKAKSWLENLQSEAPHDAACRFRGADGQYRWFNVRGEPLQAGDGRVLRWYGVLIDIDDRRKAEEALRESEYKLRQIFETVPGLIWSTGSDGSEVQKAEVRPRFIAQVQAVLNVLPAYAWYAAPSGALTFVNKRVADYLGLPKNDPLRSGTDIGAQWDAHVTVLHPDDREETRTAWSTCLRTGGAGEVSFRVRNAQGGYRWFLSRAEPLLARDGTLVLWIGVNLDIEELKCAEHALRESEYKLRQIIEAVPGLVWSNGPEGEPTHINQRMMDYGGIPFEDFMHDCWEALVHPDDYPGAAEAFAHAIETGTSYEGLMRLRRADGEFLWHHARCEPLRDQQGNIIQWYGLCVDIDERKNAEDRLRRSEAHLAEAQRLTHIGVGAFNEVEILFWSEETYRIWGFDPALGIPSREAVHRRINPEDRDRMRADVQRALSERKRYSTDYRIVLPDGTVKHLETIGVPEFSANGKLVEIVVTQMDVTERMRAQEEHERLRQLETDLAHMHRLSTMGELAASLAHEIAQPIATARNNARAALNFLDRQPPNLAEVAEALECVVGDADRAGHIVDRIRDQIKKAPPRKDRFDLNEAINEVLLLARSAIVRNGVSVQMRLADGMSAIHGDRVQLQQVILNLILNAVEAMGLVQDGPRELSVGADRSWKNGILVTVRDSGPGIDPKDRHRVFEAFYTTKNSGVGMGLAICRSIIDGHGGRLWVDANRPRGAAFQFTLPGVGS